VAEKRAGGETSRLCEAGQNILKSLDFHGVIIFTQDAR
jgi:hypothetical protein